MKNKSITSIWPTTVKYPGLSSGWEGVAWVGLHTQGKPNSPWNFKSAASVYQKLLKKPPLPKTKGHCGIMIGLASRALIGTLAAQQDYTFKKLLPDLIEQSFAPVKRSDAENDLMFGKAGALLTATEIETISPGSIPRALSKYLIQEVQKIARDQLQRLNNNQNVYVGLSHGLAGYLLSLESAHFVFGSALNDRLREELITTIANQRFVGPKNSALWPTWTNGSPGGIHGWCHGAPGIGLAFLAGYQMTGRKDYKQLAIEAMEGSHLFPSGHYSFCCGLTGKAQALIEGYRILGNKTWLKKARLIAKEADQATPQNKENVRGFHRGKAGRYYLEQRLLDPTLPLLGLGPVSVVK